jgi:DNA polymerase-3 subunit delta'
MDGLARMTQVAFLPWQVSNAKRLLAEPDSLPHALLIHGLPGVGKREFALALAASLLCEDRSGALACGQCQSCHWVASAHHPDLMQVRPEAVAAREGHSAPENEANEITPSTAGSKKLSEELKVEQIRALEPWYHRATHRGGWRIVVLYPTQALSVISANALLKALEEPPANTLFLLTSDAPDRLLPTILSRCQKFALPIPDAEVSAQWLAQQGVERADQWLAAAGGAPLGALEMAKTLDSACPGWANKLVSDLASRNTVDLPALADNLAKTAASAWLAVLQRLSVDVALAFSGLSVRYFPKLQSHWHALAAPQKLDRAHEFNTWMNQQTRLANHPLSPKLFAQVCLQRFCDVVV